MPTATCLGCGRNFTRRQDLGTHLRARLSSCRGFYTATPSATAANTPAASPAASRSTTPTASRATSPARVPVVEARVPVVEARVPVVEARVQVTFAHPGAAPPPPEYSDICDLLETLKTVEAANHRLAVGAVDIARAAIDMLARARLAEEAAAAARAAADAAAAAATRDNVESLRRRLAALLAPTPDA